MHFEQKRCSDAVIGVQCKCFFCIDQLALHLEYWILAPLSLFGLRLRLARPCHGEIERPRVTSGHKLAALFDAYIDCLNTARWIWYRLLCFESNAHVHPSMLALRVANAYTMSTGCFLKYRFRFQTHPRRVVLHACTVLTPFGCVKEEILVLHPLFAPSDMLRRLHHLE